MNTAYILSFFSDYIVSVAQDQRNLPFYFIAIQNAASAFGRIIPNQFADAAGSFKQLDSLYRSNCVSGTEVGSPTVPSMGRLHFRYHMNSRQERVAGIGLTLLFEMAHKPELVDCLHEMKP